MKRLVFGALAGLSASMTTATWMRTAIDRLPVGDRGALPQRKAADAVLDAAGDSQQDAALATHLVMGALAGALMPLVTRKTTVERGAGFGVGLALLNAFGWIPAATLSSSGNQPPLRRNALVACAYLAWGALTAKSISSLEKNRQTLFGKSLGDKASETTRKLTN